MERVGILKTDGDGGGEVDGEEGNDGPSGGDGVEDVEAGSSHRSRSVGSIGGGSGAGGGGSLASSRRERDVEMDHPVVAKTESVRSSTLR